MGIDANDVSAVTPVTGSAVAVGGTVVAVGTGAAVAVIVASTDAAVTTTVLSDAAGA